MEAAREAVEIGRRAGVPVEIQPLQTRRENKLGKGWRMRKCHRVGEAKEA